MEPYYNMKTAAWNYDDLWLGSAFSNRVFFPLRWLSNPANWFGLIHPHKPIPQLIMWLSTFPTSCVTTPLDSPHWFLPADSCLEISHCCPFAIPLFGWWFGTLVFPYIGNVIIPLDEIESFSDGFFLNHQPDYHRLSIDYPYYYPYYHTYYP